MKSFCQTRTSSTRLRSSYTPQSLNTFQRYKLLIFQEELNTRFPASITMVRAKKIFTLFRYYNLLYLYNRRVEQCSCFVVSFPFILRHIVQMNRAILYCYSTWSLKNSIMAPLVARLGVRILKNWI